MVVITMLVLFAAAIMPNLVNQKRSREIRQFYAAARNLMSDARERARADGMTRKARYDDSSRRLIIERVSTDANSNSSDSEERGLDLPEGVTADAFRVEKDDSTSSEWSIGFYADGKSESGMIQFSSEGSSQTLEISRTGGVQVVQGTMPDISDDEWDAGGYEQRV